MNFVAKLVSGRLKAQKPGPHPGSEVLSAFSENALTDSEREQLLQHLGACSDCREVVYLAMPHSTEVQKVLSFRLSRTRLVFRWGSLAASLAIVAALFATRHQVLKAPTATGVSTYSRASDEKIAEKRVPPELDYLRDGLSAVNKDAAKPTAHVVVSEAKSRPPEKRMTAKPKASLNFDDSDQVRVVSQAASDQSASPRDLPLSSRNAMALSVAAVSEAKSSTAPSPTPPAAAGNAGTDEIATNRKVARLPANAPAAHGYLAGTILDSSGAVIGNAKVTVVGPVGEKTANSDPAGKFSIEPLTPGLYSIKAEASGFKTTEVKQLTVYANETATLQVKLEPGMAAETVEVTGASPGANSAAVVAGGPAPADVTNGYIVAEKETSTQVQLQSAIATNSRKRGMVSKPAIALPQWTLSPEGVVQRSLDLGKTWQKVSVAGNTAFRALAAIGTHVWAGGNAGILYHSTDSGINWAHVEPKAADQKLTQDITHIDFTDPRNGSVSTSKGEVWITSDGGQSWRQK